MARSSLGGGGGDRQMTCAARFRDSLLAYLPLPGGLALTCTALHLPVLTWFLLEDFVPFSFFLHKILSKKLSESVLDIANDKKYIQKRLFIQYKHVFTILQVPSVRTLTLLKFHILVFITLLQTSWESDCAFNLWNNRKRLNITIYILSSAGASRQHE